MKIDSFRCLFFLFALTAAIAAFIWGYPFIHDNRDAVNTIVTVFSVLAGFLVGLIGLAGDPAAAASRDSWRVTELYRTTVSQRLIRHRWMFVLYLITLALIFLSTLCKNMNEVVIWVERAYLFFAVLAFLLSFRLPWTLTRIQMERYDAMLQQQRKDVGITV